MQIWLDTINLDVVADAAKTGIIAGVTTNPSILAGAKNVFQTLSALLELQPGPVAVQVTAEEAEEMIAEGREIYHFSNRMIIKIPVNQNGLMAIQHLHTENIPILGTGIFHPSQALLAAHQGATYISPYFSHIKEVADACETLTKMVTILKKYKTKILAASVKNIEDLVDLACLGVDAVTIKEGVYEQLVAEHPLLERASAKFQSEWRETQGNLSLKDLLNHHATI